MLSSPKVNPIGWDQGKLSVLPAVSANMVVLLIDGVSDPSLDPGTRPEWLSWWAQDAAAAWGPVLVSRTHVRALGQRMRACAEAGLDVAVRDRPMSDLALQDTGVLARVVGLGWQIAVDRVLERMNDLPDGQARALLVQALDHGVACRQAATTASLVQWAHDKGWAGQDIGVSPTTVGRAWRLWLTSPSLGHDAEDLDVLLDQVVALSSVRPQANSEVVLWKALFDDRNSLVTAQAIDAWCQRYPAAWTRMHERALVDETIPSGWLAACSHAWQEGVDCPLWQIALSSPALPAWLSRPGWGTDPQASPLASWWAHWIALEQGRLLPKAGHQCVDLPGHDVVSESLRAAGAIEPGSVRDIAMGSRSFAATLPRALCDPKWFKDRPQWVFNDPLTGSNPIFNSHNVSDFEHWCQVGFDPATVNKHGDMAFYLFLDRAMTRGKKNLAKQVAKWLDAGIAPAFGGFKGATSARVITRLESEDANFAWLIARLRDPAPQTPEETKDLARSASAPVVLNWVEELVASPAFSPVHAQALWSQLVYRDLEEDALVWGQVSRFIPMQEDANAPLWLGVWEDQDSLPSAIFNALEMISRSPAAQPTMHHHCWQEGSTVRRFAFAIDGASPSCATRLPPKDADATWWAHMLLRALARDHESEAPALQTATQMQGWIDAGLPLEGEVLDVMIQHAPLPHSEHAWSAHDAVAAAIEARRLENATPIPTHTTPRRF